MFTTFHTENYQPLADITLEKSKRPYCERHGYPLVVKTSGWKYERNAIGFDKITLVREALEKYPECTWVFFSECDAMITNFNIKLEKFSDERFHFILPADINGTNCGNFMVRNSDIGRAYLDSIEAAAAVYRHHYMYENQYIQDTVTGTFWKTIIKVVPQRLFNSYDYETLPKYPKPCKDALGVDGQWQPGDFMVHFADKSLKERVDLAEKYLTLISQ